MRYLATRNWICYSLMNIARFLQKLGTKPIESVSGQLHGVKLHHLSMIFPFEYGDFHGISHCHFGLEDSLGIHPDSPTASGKVN